MEVDGINSTILLNLTNVILIVVNAVGIEDFFSSYRLLFLEINIFFFLKLKGY